MESTGTKELVRAFCAIPLDAKLLHKIGRLQRQLAEELPGVRWSRAENLHLTLRFFGDIAPEYLEKAAKLMLSVGPLGAPFELPLERLGAFPATTRPRVLWLGFAPSTELQRLYARCEGLLEEVGIPPEQRPFVPHLTLGRARGRLPDVTALLERHSRKLAGTLPVERVIFYRSRLLPHGAEHTPLHTLELAGPTTTN